MTVSSDEISSVAERIWANLFGLPVTRGAPCPLGIDEPVTGWVHFTGDEPAGLAVAMPVALAQHLSAVLFGIDEGEAQEEEVSDVVGELTNILGGNLKARLPGTYTLSLPQVQYGATPVTELLSGAVVQAEACLVCEGQALSITFFGR